MPDKEATYWRLLRCTCLTSVVARVEWASSSSPSSHKTNLLEVAPIARELHNKPTGIRLRDNIRLRTYSYLKEWHTW